MYPFFYILTISMGIYAIYTFETWERASKLKKLSAIAALIIAIPFGIPVYHQTMANFHQSMQTR